MEKNNFTQKIKEIEEYITKRSVQDIRFQAQGYFIRDKKLLRPLEILAILDYLMGRKKKAPAVFNEYISFDNGWNTEFINAVGLTAVPDAMPPSYRSAVDAGELSLDDALSDVREMREERAYQIKKMIVKFNGGVSI